MIRRLLLIAAAVLALSVNAWAQTGGACTLEALAGGVATASPEGGPALAAELWGPADIRQGPDGAIYFVEVGRNRIREVTAEQTIRTVVGNGERQTGGDGLPGPQTSLSSVVDLEIGSDGTLHWIERGFDGIRLRRLSPGGTVETVAGGNAIDDSGDGGPAVQAGLLDTVDLAIGADGSLYLLYRGNSSELDGRVRRISAAGVIETVAGGGPIESFDFSAEDVDALESRLHYPSQILAVSDGSLLIRQARDSPLRRLTREGRLEIVRTRLGEYGQVSETPVPFKVQRPLSVDREGRIYWTERGDVRRIGDDLRPEVVWTTPDGEPDVSTIGVFSDGTLLATRLHRMERLVGESESEPLAGVGRASLVAGDGGPALEASMFPFALASAPDDGFYVGDTYTRRVRLVRDGVVSNFAGTGGLGEIIEGGPAVEAPIPSLGELASDGQGNLFISSGYAIWRVSADGVITRYAGDGGLCSREGGCNLCGDGGPAALASLGPNIRMALGPDGTVFIYHEQFGALSGRRAVLRKVSPQGTIESLLVDPSGRPRRMIVDPEGRLVIFDNNFGRRLVEDRFERLPAPLGVAFGTSSLVSAPDGTIYVAGFGRSLLRVLPDGSSDVIIPQVFSPELTAGVGGPAFEAMVGGIRSLALNAGGDLLIGDTTTDRVWRIRDVAQCPATPETTPLVLSAAAPGGIAVGGLFSMFGQGLGPEEGVVAAPDGGGRYSRELAGTEVWIGGQRAPLLFVSAGQINGVLPVGPDLQEGRRLIVGTTKGWFARARLRRNQEEWPPMLAFLGDFAPALFALAPGRAAALNQDGSVNGPLAPAPPGSVIVLFGSGGGELDPLPETGRIVAGTPLSQVTQPVSVTIDRQPAQVLYAGAAPGLVSGVLQVNVLVPDDLARLGALEVVVAIDEVRNTSQRLNVIVGR